MKALYTISSVAASGGATPRKNVQKMVAEHAGTRRAYENERDFFRDD